ncbi:MAG: hypothetical protein KGO49_06960 [Gammaproteobacteria bacterium]|nr:hypothetical protein [Gammaproteobacteria bacterium]
MNDVDLINSLGNCSAVARLLKIKPPSVSEWKRRGTIPIDKRIRLAVIAEDRGITTRKELFPDSYQEIWIELRHIN